MRYWKPEDIFTVPCPFCQGEIEFWKDEPFRLCPSCRKEVRNPKQDFGCAEWCKHSQECLGSAPGQSGRAAPLDERILAAMVAILGETHPQIPVAAKCLEHHPDPQALEQGSLLIARAVSMLRGLGNDQPGESPDLTRRILEKAGVSRPAIDEICQALAAQST